MGQVAAPRASWRAQTEAPVTLIHETAELAEVMRPRRRRILLPHGVKIHHRVGEPTLSFLPFKSLGWLALRYLWSVQLAETVFKRILLLLSSFIGRVV